MFDFEKFELMDLLCDLAMTFCVLFVAATTGFALAACAFPKLVRRTDE